VRALRWAATNYLTRAVLCDSRWGERVEIRDWCGGGGRRGEIVSDDTRLPEARQARCSERRRVLDADLQRTKAPFALRVSTAIRQHEWTLQATTTGFAKRRRPWCGQTGDLVARDLRGAIAKPGDFIGARGVVTRFCVITSPLTVDVICARWIEAFDRIIRLPNYDRRTIARWPDSRGSSFRGEVRTSQ